MYFFFEQYELKHVMGFYHRVQRAIVKRGLELLGIRGMLLYTTTSLNPVENEAVVASVLKEAKGELQSNG